MKKLFVSMALMAGMSISLIAGSQAQTITGSSGGTSFSANMSLAVLTPPSFTYDYFATVTSVTPGDTVNEFAFNFQEPVKFVSTTGDFVGPAASSTAQIFTFVSPTGLTAALGNNTTSFSFFSPDAPNGQVGVNASVPGVGGGTYSAGPLPCTTVPEVGSLAFLGLGLLPLAFIARRRIGQSL